MQCLRVAGRSNGSLTWQTGLPFTVTDQQSVSGVIGGGAERPNLVGSDIRVSNPTVGVGGQFLNPAAFALPANFTLGNAPRNVGSGPRQSIINASLFKTFKLTEAWNLQFRTEAFNLPNHPVFGQPNTAFGNANFGKITSTAGVVYAAPDSVCAEVAVLRMNHVGARLGMAYLSHILIGAKCGSIRNL